MSAKYYGSFHSGEDQLKISSQRSSNLFFLSGIYGGNRLRKVIEAEEEGTNVAVLSVRCDLS